MARKYKIEAAFIYNFFNYITWPDYSSPEQLTKPVICITPGSPIKSYLEYVQKRIEASRELAVREVNTENFEGCHVFYTHRKLRFSVIENARESHTLLVGSGNETLTSSMINLVEKDRKINIRIDHKQLAQLGYQVSSRLLTLTTPEGQRP